MLYNSAIRALGTVREYDAAMRLLRRLGRPNGASMCSAVHACQHSGRWREMRALLRGMEQPRVGLTPQEGVLPYSVAMEACNAHGRHEEALELYAELDARPFAVRPNGRVYAAAIDACVQLEQWDEAMRLLGSMRAHSVEKQNRDGSRSPSQGQDQGQGQDQDQGQGQGCG